MKSRRVRLTVLALALVLRAAAALPDATGPEAEIAQRIRARLDAYRQGDARLWATFVDDDCVCAAETKADILKAIANRPPGVKNWYGDILDLQAHLHGDVAVVRYRTSEYTEVNGQLNTLEEWRTETHLRQDGRWILIAAAENPITADPKAIVLPREVLARYVGKYQYTPGSVDVVTLEGDRLFVQPSSDPKVELLAEDATTFFAKGEPWRIVFRTDSQGVVTSLVFRQQGQEYVAKRLP
jgi:hypothetical protein